MKLYNEMGRAGPKQREKLLKMRLKKGTSENYMSVLFIGN